MSANVPRVIFDIDLSWLFRDVTIFDDIFLWRCSRVTESGSAEKEENISA